MDLERENIFIKDKQSFEFNVCSLSLVNASDTDVSTLMDKSKTTPHGDWI